MPATVVVPEQMVFPFESLTVTVENGSAVPEIVGRLLVVNELFGGPEITGAGGGVVFTVNVTVVDAGPVLPARSVARALIT